MKEQLVSVIIPVYNCEKYIKQSAESVLNGDYKNIELVLVDDGSTDGSLAMCGDIANKDGRVTVYHKENGGASSARNYGLERAKGEYVYFVDADDFIVDGAIAKLTEKAESTRADVIYFEAYNFSESENIEAISDGFTFNRSYRESRGEDLIAKLVKNRDYHAAPFLYFIKREVLYGIRFKEGVMFEDELFSFELLLKAKKVVILNEKFYKRRMREGSVMTSTGKGVYRFKSISVVLDEIIKIYKEKKSAKTKAYLERICVLWQGRYEELTSGEKVLVDENYKSILAKIKDNRYFSSIQVRLRLKSFALWRIYTAPKKFVLKIKKVIK